MNTRGKRWRHRPWPTRLAVYLVICLPLLIRLHALGRYGSAGDPATQLRLVIWELPILASLVALHEYASRLRSLPARLPVRVLVSVAWTVLLLDAIVFHLFDLRVAIPDVIRYGSHVQEAMMFIDLRVAGLVLVLVAVLMGMKLITARTGSRQPGHGGRTDQPDRSAHPPPSRSMLRELFLVGGLIALIVGSGFTPKDDGDLYGWRVQNWFSLNIQNSLHRSYPSAFLDSVRFELALEDESCEVTETSGDRPDVLIVLLESFSSGLSPMYGGSRSAHPELERISLEGLRFTRFFANGFTTEHGLTAILGGRLPVFPAEVAVFSLTGNTAFAGHYGLTTSLPACADSLGYHTEFLTSGDLSFTNKGNWLRSIGFARVEGHDAPEYDGLPRGAFQSVTDSALYARVLDRIHELKAGPPPFLLVVEGVESHGPYRGMDGMLQSLRSADASLGQFYDQLVESGFLETGVVMMISDHRVQQALRKDERASFGPEAAVRVPAVLLGHGVTAGVDSVPRHQLDVLPTIMRRMGGRGESTRLATAMTDPPPSRCIPWLHGGRRDEIVALCNDQYVRIRLDADRTRVVEGSPTDESAHLIAAIHRVRIDGSNTDRQPGTERAAPAPPAKETLGADPGTQVSWKRTPVGPAGNFGAPRP